MDPESPASNIENLQHISSLNDDAPLHAIPLYDSRNNLKQNIYGETDFLMTLPYDSGGVGVFSFEI